MPNLFLVHDSHIVFIFTFTQTHRHTHVCTCAVRKGLHMVFLHSYVQQWPVSSHTMGALWWALRHGLDLSRNSVSCRTIRLWPQSDNQIKLFFFPKCCHVTGLLSWILSTDSEWGTRPPLTTQPMKGNKSVNRLFWVSIYFNAYQSDSRYKVLLDNNF